MMKHKTLIILTVIFILAVFLRAISAQHSNVITDESVFAVRSIHFLSSGMYSSMDQAPLHLALVDLSERAFGVSGWSSRLPNILFGGLAVLVIYLIVCEFGDRRWALLSAALFAFSPFSILFNIEPDMTGIFFTLLSVLFYIKALRKDFKYLTYSFFFLGIAALAKLVSLFILPAYLLGFIYYNWKKENPLVQLEHKKIKVKKTGIKILLWSVLLSLLAFSPILLYNILLYVHKGYPDIIFARSLGISGYEGFFGDELRDWSFGSKLNVMWIFIQRLWTYDVIILFSAIIGIIYSFVRKKKENIIILTATMFILFFVSGTAGTSKSHYIYLFPFLAILGGYAFAEILAKIKHNKKIFLGVTAIILVLSSVILIQNKILEPEGMVDLREEAKKIEDNALVIVDSRIYRGNIAWNFHDKHYVESQYFPQVHQMLNDQNLSKVAAPVYFVECIQDDCGWGRGIKENQQVQELNEGLVALFSEGAIEVIDVPGKQYSFKIYKTMMMVPPEVYDTIEGTHQFLFYSVGWKDMTQNYDYYEISSPTYQGLDYLGKIIFYLMLGLSLASLYLVFKLLRKNLRNADSEEPF